MSNRDWLTPLFLVVFFGAWLCAIHATAIEARDEARAVRKILEPRETP